MKTCIQFFRTTLLSFALALAGQNLIAQDLHVFYNLHNDSILYRKNDKTLARPKIRRGDRVVVHFTEYNPYLYDAKVQVEQTKANSAASALPSFFGSFQAMMPGLSSFFPTGASDTAAGEGMGFPMLDAPLVQMGEKSVTLRGLFSNARGADQVLKQAEAELAEMAELRAETESLYAELKAIEKADLALNLAALNLPELPLNPGLKPSTIRKIAGDLFQTAFRVEAGSDGSLDDVFRARNLSIEKAQVLAKLSENQAALDAKSAHLEPLALDLNNLDLGSQDASKFARDLKDIRKKTQQARKETDAFVAAQKATASPTRSAEELTALFLRFQELRACSFSHETAFEVNKDVVDVHAEFTPRDSMGRALPSKSKEIHLESSGGLSVSTGFGLSFGGFSSPAQTFDVRNEAIVADNAGDFQPYITSFLHLYPHSSRSWALAGTLGIGLPLRGVGDGQSPAFFLGPSLLVGRGQRVVVTGGLLLGEVARLAKGYQLGDSFSNDNGDIPTQQRYESGLFFGASFKL